MSEEREAQATRLLEVARGLGPRIWACRDQIERDRRLPASLVDEFARADLFRMLVPRSLGGLEVDPLTAIRVIEELARVDGSAAWAALIGNSALFTAWLPSDGARDVVADDPCAPVAGVLAPTGRATLTSNGYRATGQWAFASGCDYAAWVVGTCVIFNGDAPALDAHGQPELRVLFFPRRDCEILDTWSVGGLRGTGSNDFAVHDVFVPFSRSFNVRAAPVEQGPLYRLPLRALLSILLPSVAFGIARGAIYALVELAVNKTPSNSRTLLRDRGMAQVQLAQAEATLRAARAFLFDAVGTAWAEVSAGRDISFEQHTLLRLAATHATAGAAQAVDLVHGAAGGTAVYTRSPLERAFRDVHTASQHWAVAASIYEPVGRVLFGLEPGITGF